MHLESWDSPNDFSSLGFSPISSNSVTNQPTENLTIRQLWWPLPLTIRIPKWVNDTSFDLRKNTLQAPRRNNKLAALQTILILALRGHASDMMSRHNPPSYNNLVLMMLLPGECPPSFLLLDNHWRVCWWFIWGLSWRNARLQKCLNRIGQLHIFLNESLHTIFFTNQDFLENRGN